MLATVTDLSAYRAAVRPVVSKACSIHEAAERMMHANSMIADAQFTAGVRMFCAWQRVMLRTMVGV